MYSLQLTCREDAIDGLTGELWEAGTLGIHEIDQPDGTVLLVAGFDAAPAAALMDRLRKHHPVSRREEQTDWVRHTKDMWPGREAGKTLYLAPPWSEKETPAGRQRLVHTPGLACGTGEHPCTQLAIMALEQCIRPGSWVADVGSGSGILTIAAFLLGAGLVLALDTDEHAPAVARNDFQMNRVEPLVAIGSADSAASGKFDVTVANISGTVVLAILDELMRIARPEGTLILTGFPEAESMTFETLLPGSRAETLEGWSCIVAANDL
jgi:ribosomal protein L11 methyltransferase